LFGVHHVPQNLHVRVDGSGNLRKAAYCYAVGDDLYEAYDEEVEAHTEVVEQIPSGCPRYSIWVLDGKVEK
jgi:hypothetical protein